MNADTIFENHRKHLLGIAYRMLGEMASAEDVVQDTWLRWRTVEAAEVRDARAWLSTAAVRLSLDALRSARARREQYVGPWLPEPLLPDDARAFSTDDPEAKAELASDLSLALLHVLERLGPEERAAFILHDAFDRDYDEIAGILGKSEDACRKLVSRARERVRTDRPRFSASHGAQRDLLKRFIKATASGDPGEVMKLLAPDAIAYSDGGGRASAALNPIYGADKIARFTAGTFEKFYADAAYRFAFADINGSPGFLIFENGKLTTAVTIEVDDGAITALYAVRNPEKLTRLAQLH